MNAESGKDQVVSGIICCSFRRYGQQEFARSGRGGGGGCERKCGQNENQQMSICRRTIGLLANHENRLTLVAFFGGSVSVHPSEYGLWPGACSYAICKSVHCPAFSLFSSPKLPAWCIGTGCNRALIDRLNPAINHQLGGHLIKGVYNS